MQKVVDAVQIIMWFTVFLYFFGLLKGKRKNKQAINKAAKKEMERLKRLKKIRLPEPLSEKMRPQSAEEIVGQDSAMEMLRASICGSNPQHVLIYGPPGTGKTAAARVILKEAVADDFSPFSTFSKFVEIDASTLRYDERGIADPLVGSVHDPIYQGAGAFGNTGIPNPKPGAVTKAHAGILFIDEIGELSGNHMNKLLKILEDRRVFFESSYYNPEDENLPEYIHEIFRNGLPADFRLIGSTTKTPDEMPEAIRSRCVEVFFNSLNCGQIAQIAENVLKKSEFTYDDTIIDIISRCSKNGREAVNIIQLAGSMAQGDGRSRITKNDLGKIIKASHLEIKNIDITGYAVV